MKPSTFSRTKLSATILTLLGATAIGFLPPSTALAQSKTSSTYSEVAVDGPERINNSGKLRMLSQRIAASTCTLTSGIAVDQSREILEAAELEFEQILNALQFGDTELGIVKPEERRKTLVIIEKVAAEWAPIKQSIDIVLRDSTDIDQAHLVDDANLTLLAVTVDLAAEISNQYANPFEMSQADAMLIDIAGRQRMLTQRIAKDACEVWTGYHSEAAKEDLAKTMQIFELTLNALQNGMPEAGITAAPTETIADELLVIQKRWNDLKIHPQTLVDGGEISEEAKVELYLGLNQELADLNHLVGQYAQYAKRAH